MQLIYYSLNKENFTNLKQQTTMKKFYFITFLTTILSACDSASMVNNSTVRVLDLNRYLGSWYEIARLDHPFERGMDYVKAHYMMRTDGKINVLNTSIKDGKMKDARGVAKTTGVPGVLRVSFFRPFYNDYRVLLVDENYQYALVGGSNEKYLWILSRESQLDDATKRLLLAEADRRGYDTSKLIWVEQPK